MSVCQRDVAWHGGEAARIARRWEGGCRRPSCGEFKDFGAIARARKDLSPQQLVDLQREADEQLQQGPQTNSKARARAAKQMDRRRQLAEAEFGQQQGSAVEDTDAIGDRIRGGPHPARLRSRA
ncbi:unnamed protein product [Prorocentrum cordatum]|uniref:Uncharacterized protein n=1 Tax=Prorocentrum cordatum TaxID=2364126 RepID=A0ABN9QKX1_9DINO|nr:unnamed protein product [Polarella glacialis]